MRLVGRVAIPLVLVAVALAPLAQAADHSVTTPGLFWSPATLEIEPGDSVTFSNPTTTPHTWVRDDGTDSCSLPCTRTFPAAATVAYHCGVHPGMKGTLQVGPGVVLTVSSPATGAVVAGLVRVEGTATYAPGTIEGVTVRFEGGPTIAATLDGSGASVAWSADVPSEAFPDGPRGIVARATSVEGIASELRVPVVIDNPDRVDLRVTQVFARSAAIDVTNTITYTLRNDGNAASGPFIVQAEYLYHGTWRPIGETAQGSVGPQLVAQGSIAWTPAPRVLVGTFPIRVVADAAGATNDVAPANNVRAGSAGWFTSAVAGIDLTEPV